MKRHVFFFKHATSMVKVCAEKPSRTYGKKRKIHTNKCPKSIEKRGAKTKRKIEGQIAEHYLEMEPKTELKSSA